MPADLLTPLTVPPRTSPPRMPVATAPANLTATAVPTPAAANPAAPSDILPSLASETTSAPKFITSLSAEPKPLATSLLRSCPPAKPPNIPNDAFS